MGNQHPRPEEGKVQRLSLKSEYTQVGGSGGLLTGKAEDEDIVSPFAESAKR